MTTVAIDIIFDPVRCDLSRAATQTQWLNFAKTGAILGFVAGPPCESWTAARAAGGRAGSHTGDGGPRQIRSWNLPFGVAATNADEQAHIGLANCLLLFGADLALELLAGISFFVMEHPAPPDDAYAKDLPTICETGPIRLLRDHPAVRYHLFQQGRFGAKSPKPTVFLEKGLDTLATHLRVEGVCPLAKALKLGKTDGTYNTASLKEYPPRLCGALGKAVGDFVATLDAYGTSYTLEAPSRKAWINEILQNQNFSAQMGTDRAGSGF